MLEFVRSKPLGAAGAAYLLLALTAAVLAPVLATHDPLDQDYGALLQPPSPHHFLGTDEFGRDEYSRLLDGGRVTFMVAFSAIGIGSVAGLILGIVSGYFGGWIDEVVQRITDVLLALPALLLGLALVASLGPGLEKVIIAVSVVSGPRTLRVIRGSVLSAKENLYVEAARSHGATALRIMHRHILPGVMAPYLVVTSTLLGSAILIEATLSFLGLGVPPPYASWGQMLSGAVSGRALTAPWLVIVPGLSITLVVMAFNLLGDALRDAWDPRLRGS